MPVSVAKSAMPPVPSRRPPARLGSVLGAMQRTTNTAGHSGSSATSATTRVAGVAQLSTTRCSLSITAAAGSSQRARHATRTVSGLTPVTAAMSTRQRARRRSIGTRPRRSSQIASLAIEEVEARVADSCQLLTGNGTSWESTQRGLRDHIDCRSRYLL